MCVEIESYSVCVEIVCREKERDGREPVTSRVWFRMRVRVRVIWHFVRFYIFWHFVLWHFVHARFLAFCPDTIIHIYYTIHVINVYYNLRGSDTKICYSDQFQSSSS